MGSIDVLNLSDQVRNSIVLALSIDSYVEAFFTSQVQGSLERIFKCQLEKLLRFKLYADPMTVALLVYWNRKLADKGDMSRISKNFYANKKHRPQQIQSRIPR